MFIPFTDRCSFILLVMLISAGNMNRPIDVWTFPNGGPAAKAGVAAASASSASAAAAASSSATKNSNKAANGTGNSNSSASFSTAGPGAPSPNPAPLLSFMHAEFVTSIPAAVAWHPTRVQIAGCTGSGRLYVFGASKSDK